MTDETEKSEKNNRVRSSTDIRDILYPFHSKTVNRIDDHAVIITAHVSEGVENDLLLNARDIEDCLTILVGNAKSKTAKGRIHIHIDQSHIQSIKCLKLIVADTGVGLTDEQQNAIFRELDLFRQSGLFPSSERTSRTLRRVYKILNACDGTLQINSKCGNGSEFVITFPVKSAKEVNLGANEDIIELEEIWRNGPEPDLEILSFEPSEKRDAITSQRDAEPDVFAPEVAVSETDAIFEPNVNTNLRANEPKLRRRGRIEGNPRISFTGLKILIVEDIIANQEVLKSLLEPAGCIVSTADNGQEAVDLTNVQTFDAVLMDVRMPIMNGVVATQTIRAGHTPNRNVPIIALTADASEENNAYCLAAGADVFLTKPVVIDELFSVIRFACAQKSAQMEDSAIRHDNFRAYGN